MQLETGLPDNPLLGTITIAVQLGLHRQRTLIFAWLAIADRPFAAHHPSLLCTRSPAQQPMRAMLTAVASTWL